MKVLYQKETLPIGASLARQNHLYIAGWQMNGIYKTFEKYTWDSLKWGVGAKQLLALSFVEGIPVSCAILHYKQIMAFTKVAFRRQGHADALVKMILDEGRPEGLFATTGIDCSEFLWESNNINNFGK